MFSSDLRTVKHKCIYAVLFREFASCQYNEIHSYAKVLPNNTLIASKPITTNYSNLRPPPNPYHSKLYNKSLIFSFFPADSFCQVATLPPPNYICVCVCIVVPYNYL